MGKIMGFGGHESLCIFVHYVPNLLSVLDPADRIRSLQDQYPNWADWCITLRFISNPSQSGFESCRKSVYTLLLRVHI